MFFKRSFNKRKDSAYFLLKKFITAFCAYVILLFHST